MKTRVTLQLLEEARRWELRFTCDECAHFQGDRCAHGWPEGERSRTLREGETIAFCKEFEGGP
ncbi:MAG: hypothetical protein ACXVEF_24950 [Polyangiales bacterium]